MFALLGAALSSIISGGATGLLGIIIQRFFDMKSKSQDLELLAINNAHALAMADKEIERTTAEWNARKDIATEEVRGRIEEADRVVQQHEADAAAVIQEASYEADKATYLTPGVLRSKSRMVTWTMALVDATRGLIRPVLTAFLVWVAFAMYLDMQAILAKYGHELPIAVAQELTLQVMSTLLYLATVAVVWWFGTRPPQKNRAG